MGFVMSKKRRERDIKEESPGAKAADRLSELPDDILLRIISLLTVKGSVRTSVLSHRWRHLWTRRPNLDFDIQNIHEADFFHFERTPAQQKIFINSVDKFLQHHAGSGVQKFRFQYAIDEALGHNLEHWLRFAVASGTADMEISLVQSTDGGPYDIPVYGHPYDFPSHLFTNGKTSSVGKLELGYCILRIPPNLDGFSTLKAVKLWHVNIVDTDFQNLLSVCHALELLQLTHCLGLISLKLSSKASALKFLGITNCCGMERIEVDAMNLVTFNYSGGKIFFNLRNAPWIKEAFIGFNYGWFDFVDVPLTEILRELPRVETLMLALFQIKKVEIPPPNAHRLMHLKQLTLLVNSSSSSNHNILWVETFLTFAPLLEKYYIELVPLFGLGIGLLSQKEGEEEPMKKRHMSIFAHEQLKVIKFSNFSAEEREFELAMFMVNSTIVLEKLVIDTCWEAKQGSKSSSSSEMECPAVCQRVNEYFVGKLPSTVKLVIL